MEEIFSDALGLFGAEVVEDDGYVQYGGLKLAVVPKVRFRTIWTQVTFFRSSD